MPLSLRLCCAAIILSAGALLPMPTHADQPDFGPNVLLLDPATPDVQPKLDAIFARQERSEFGPDRFALLFKPGKYTLDVRVGFYTQVAGLGASPDDVEISGAVRATAEWRKGNATCNFWRSVENLSIAPTPAHTPLVWAVSQGTSMRRVHVKGDIHLWDGGWSSGGFLADSTIDGRINSGSQQQWLSRNDSWGVWQGGNWNMVFVGVDNPPAGAWPEHPYTTIDSTPIIRERPYLTIDSAGKFSVIRPRLRTNVKGTSWSSSPDTGDSISLDQFHLAHPGKDTAATINAALAAGKHLLLTPGIYHLAEPIRITRPGAIILGLGYPTLIPDTGARAMTVADVDGVTLAGLLLEAGPTESPSLLQLGESRSTVSHAADPTFLFDVFCRVGGAAPGSAACMLTINSANVVADNLWLWRADHGAGATWTASRNRHGLIVNADDVTIYGLFVEHTQEYQTLWNGERGRVYFYQSEMPYDPPSADAWSHEEITGYASYKVDPTVTTHEAWGLGVYCVFKAAPIVADRAIEAPEAPGGGVRLHHMITVRLGGGQPGSGIRHILNDRGEAVVNTDKDKARLD